MSNKTIDMTQGKILPALLKFAIPLIIGSLFQQLYTFVDSAIVGNFISNDALTAIGVTGSLNFLVLGLTMGSAIGFSIPISQSVGEGNETEINKNFWNGLYLTLTIGLVVSLGISPFIRPLLILMNTSDKFLDMATTYLTIIFIGQISVVLYNYLAGTIRAFGDSTSPFKFLVISSVTNVILDLFFVLVIPMGVAGVAVATVISQILSVLLCVWWIRKKKLIQKFDAKGNKLYIPSGEHIKKICLIGLPLGLEYSVCSIGNVVLQGSINTLGDVYATAQYCGEKIRSIATIPMESIGTAMATYAAQNFGAKKYDRIKQGVKYGILIQAVYCVASFLVLLLLGKPLIYLLLGTTETVEALLSADYLLIISALFIFHGSLMIFRNTVQGMGHGASTLASSVMEIIGRSLSGILAVSFGSFFLICVSAPMAWALALICCVILFSVYIKKASTNKEKH